MILLRHDCLVFKTTAGEQIPCSAHEVTIELVGDSANWLDEEMILHAAEAVLHYFKVEKDQQTVSVGEFSEALERVLRGFGLEVKSAPSVETLAPAKPSVPRRVIEADLHQLASQSTEAWELCFFPRLRSEVRRQLDGSPLVLRFHGLRPCVKLLTGAKRWSAQCRSLNDQIVDYLRASLSRERSGEGCALVVH
jgi:hypothetical protein